MKQKTIMYNEFVKKVIDKNNNIVLIGNHTRVVGIFLPDEKESVIEDFCWRFKFTIM